MAQRWEYDASTVFGSWDEIRDSLNSWGSEGWELVSVVGSNMNDGLFTAFWKRPLA